MRIGIIGGAGRMGRLYAKSFLDKGHDILISDIDKKGIREHYSGVDIQVCEDNRELARRSDLVIYSVPIVEGTISGKS